MFRACLLLPLLAIAPRASSTEPIPPKASPSPAGREGYHQVELNGHNFTLPAGFTIELAAGPELAARPIVAAFDDKGHLYVCDSSGSNEPVATQVKKKPHRIVRLEDTDGDGRYDKSTVFVANVMFPEGAMWLNGSLYVAAPPQILKFTDTDGDGKADKKEIWFDGKTLTGCANDLHGPYLGPDGWIYWCKGAFAKQEYTLPNGKKLGTRAAHIFRARPDGSRIEPVMTGGMDNPVDVVFTPGGERIFSTTFFQHPANGQRDGLVHAIYGGVYGKDHDPVHEHPWTSPHLMPAMTHLGPAAPCGLHRYESDQFGKDYENNVFCCQFNLRKVSRHVLVPTGSTFTTKDSDFVVSDQHDFHPTDVLEDADGSLLILDTGGWYKLCCPSSQLVKPDVTGAIYRVKKLGSHKVEDPRGAKIDWNRKDGPDFNLLGDPRPAVQRQAIEFWSVRGRAIVPDLLKLVLIADRDGRLGRNLIRALARVDAPEARAAVREAVECNIDDFHLAAIHTVGLWRDSAAGPLLVKRLKHEDSFIRRAAAEALGRIGERQAVPALLDAVADATNDRALHHALTYALIEIADPTATTEGLKHPSPRVRRAALAALDAMADGQLGPQAVLAELDAKDPALRATAWWIAGKHPQWGDRLAGHFRERLKQIEKLAPNEQDELADQLIKFAKNEAVQKVIGEGVLEEGSRRLALRVMARSGVKALPPSWKLVLGSAIGAKDEVIVREGFAALRALPLTKEDFGDVITDASSAHVANGRKWTEFEHLLILAASPPGTVTLSATDLAFALRSLGRDEAPASRGLAADVLVRVKLAGSQLSILADALKTANPLDLAKLLPAFAKSTDEQVGLALVAALSHPTLRATVRAEQVKPILDKYPKPVRDAADELYGLLAEARKDESAKLDRLVRELPPGDIRRGQVVFNGTKAQCAACHTIGYVGGRVGPDLTRIGGIRTERDLLEAIVFPSASFVRSYEPIRVMMVDGRTLSGILKTDAPDEIVLVVGADKEERLARADIESIAPGTVSIMPAGLDQQLTPRDLADLVAFLKACK